MHQKPTSLPPYRSERLRVRVTLGVLILSFAGGSVDMPRNA
jgi:hypothetical protein